MIVAENFVSVVPSPDSGINFARNLHVIDDDKQIPRLAASE